MSLGTRTLFAAPASLLALGLVIAAAAISVFASTPGDVETHAQQSTGENQVFVPGVVSNAEGTYVAFPTPTPLATPTATPTSGVQDAPNRLFVTTSGDDAGEGSRDDPFETITHALEVAREIDGAEIYVASGSYNETIGIYSHPGVMLLGGYHEGDWERVPMQHSDITSPDFTALYIADSENVHVEGFNLPSGRPMPGGGPLERSRVAVIVEFSSGVTLVDNSIVSDNGLDGTNGMRGLGGAAGSPGVTGSWLGGCPPADQGGFGGAGAANGGRGGDGGAVDGFNGSDGQSASASVRGGKGGTGGVFVAGAGGNGGNGDDGTANLVPGAGGTLIYFTEDGNYQPAHGEDGRSTNRLGGAGGGGGGGQAGGLFFVCGGGGGGGGGGGHPAQFDGGGGRSGGASFGIFILESEVSVIDSEIRTGNGGRGGQGGSSGIGGPGGDGGAGGDNGGDGGRGGRGAPSAPGGGGGGGPSIGILTDGDSEVTRSGITFDLGQPGMGGLGGSYPNLVDRAPTGAPGLREEFYQDVPIGLPTPPEPTN